MYSAYPKPTKVPKQLPNEISQELQQAPQTPPDSETTFVTAPSSPERFAPTQTSMVSPVVCSVQDEPTICDDSLSSHQIPAQGPSQPPSSQKPETEATTNNGDEDTDTQPTCRVEVFNVIPGSKSSTPTTVTINRSLDFDCDIYQPCRDIASSSTVAATTTKSTTSTTETTMRRRNRNSKPDTSTSNLSSPVGQTNNISTPLHPNQPEKSKESKEPKEPKQPESPQDPNTPLTFHTLWQHQEPSIPVTPYTLPFPNHYPSPNLHPQTYPHLASTILLVHNHILKLLQDPSNPNSETTPTTIPTTTTTTTKPIRPTFRRRIQQQLIENPDLWKELDELMGMLGRKEPGEIKEAIRMQWRKRVGIFVGAVVGFVDMLCDGSVVCRTEEKKWRKMILVLERKGLEGGLGEVVGRVRGVVDDVDGYLRRGTKMGDKDRGRIGDKVREVREMWFRVNTEAEGKFVGFNQAALKRDGRGRVYRTVEREDLLVMVRVVQVDQTWDLLKIVEKTYNHVKEVCVVLRDPGTPILIPEKRKLRERIKGILRTNESMWLGETEPWKQTKTILEDLENLLIAIDRYREGNKILLNDGMIDLNVLCEECGNIEKVCTISGEIQGWWRISWRSFRKIYPEKVGEMEKVDSCPGWIFRRIERRIEELESDSMGKSCDVTVG